MAKKYSSKTFSSVEDLGKTVEESRVKIQDFNSTEDNG